jgi:MFS transporter, ACS family, D-galactonate transporter
VARRFRCGLAESALSFAGASIASPSHVSTLPLIVGMLALTGVFLGIGVSNGWAITQTLAGPLAAGRWTGVQNSIGNLAGWVAPALTGFLVDRTGRF